MTHESDTQARQAVPLRCSHQSDVTKRTAEGADRARAPIRARQRASHTRDATMLGALFESLVALNLRVYAQAAEADVRHLRTQRGEHEVAFVISGTDHGIVGIEVKLSATVEAADVKQLSGCATESVTSCSMPCSSPRGRRPIAARTASRSSQSSPGPSWR